MGMDWMMVLKAFVTGGLICVICQLLIDYTRMTPARILVLLVTLGVFLTAVGVYKPLVDFAGAGATVPLLGFGYSLAVGVEKSVAENGLLGAFTGGVTQTSGGIAVAIFLGFVCALLAKSKDKS
jgi:stage V sporulation protein AE